jgi:hypothetical protein
MEPKNFDNLNDEFDLPIQEIVVLPPKEITTSEDLHLDADYREIRANLKDLIKRGAEAIDGILLVASETQQPRAYEVVATVIKSVADANKELLAMHKQMQDIKKSSPIATKQSGQITNNSIFVGSTSELQALLKGRLDQFRPHDET